MFEGESINNNRLTSGVRGECLDIARVEAYRRENSEAARGCPLQPAFPIGFSITSTTSHDPPRDNLNDEGTLLFFCLSHRSTKRLFLFYFVLVHDAESTHRTCTPMSPPRRAPEDLRRVARCELPSLANSHARVRGRVTFRGRGRVSP